MNQCKRSHHGVSQSGRLKMMDNPGLVSVGKISILGFSKSKLWIGYGDSTTKEYDSKTYLPMKPLKLLDQLNQLGLIKICE